MTSIPRRAEIVTKIGNLHASDLRAAIDRVGTRLNAATELPLVLAVEELGQTHATRQAVLERLKQQGWCVEPETDGDGQPTGYRVQ